MADRSVAPGSILCVLLAAVKLRLLRWRRTPHAIPRDHPQINPSPPIPASAVVADPACVRVVFEEVIPPVRPAVEGVETG